METTYDFTVAIIKSEPKDDYPKYQLADPLCTLSGRMVSYLILIYDQFAGQNSIYVIRIFMRIKVSNLAQDQKQFIMMISRLNPLTNQNL